MFSNAKLMAALAEIPGLQEMLSDPFKMYIQGAQDLERAEKSGDEKALARLDFGVAAQVCHPILTRILHSYSTHTDPRSVSDVQITVKKPSSAVCTGLCQPTSSDFF